MNPRTTIQGREVNQKDFYQLCWKTEKKKQDKAFYEDGYIWFPITNINPTYKKERVYDIEVENSHSFTANGVIAHNCQDLSLAGKQKGMSKDSGTRSGLLWEVERLLNECKELPQILLMENVIQVHDDKNIDDFEKWREYLTDKGYTNFLQDLNAKNYGVAQSRTRAYMVSILGNANYIFPEPINLNYVMEDYLQDESEIEDKYYLKSKKVTDFLQKLKDEDKLTNV
jgi:DNA (cytosine-5)-methyltransferase 1